MSKILVADTGPLIALAIVDLLPLLPRLVYKVYVPDAVIAESLQDLSKAGAQTIYQALTSSIIEQRSVNLDGYFTLFADVLDRGEAEVLALSKQISGIALVDEQRARKIAAHNDIAVTGSAALILKAKQLNLIPTVRPLLEKLATKGYRLAPSLIEEVCRRANENIV